jgi:hypothetical protein
MNKRCNVLDGLTHNPGSGPPLDMESSLAAIQKPRHSPLAIQNRIQIDLVGHDENGRQITKQHVDIEGNIMCTYGLSRIVALLAGGAMDASSWIGGMRIGTDSTAAVSTDNQLGASTGSVDLTDAADVIEAGARTLRCVATFASDNPAGSAQIREIGIFASSNVTTGLVARRDLTGANSVNKGASDSINVSYDLVFVTA